MRSQWAVLGLGAVALAAVIGMAVGARPKMPTDCDTSLTTAQTAMAHEVGRRLFGLTVSSS